MEKPKVADLISLAQESTKTFNSPTIASGSLASSSSQPQLLVRAPTGRVVSLWTCTKISLISFGVGVVVGFMLKARVRRWATKLLKKIRDD
ncbi:transmembrane protein [Rhynchospora pubera]|uniref:Transmembrane protein n=1 Tax=Rhynchospora pubera TaxID=906938 RepID=A0AAV8EUH1_9POAL|nr:transmembrane protein [Rhynchospora pubera]KAJ4789358.1 transmembrane protein [Rhynchospora pubera]KAJ4808874.1 transmembrane protein [Rhynchospora pubera]